MMGLKKEQREIIKKFLIENVTEHSRDIAKTASSFFGISRQAVHNYIKQLIAEDVLIVEGKTRSVSYKLKEKEYVHEMDIDPNVKEDVVWSKYIVPVLPELKKNVYDICYYGFTEMMNNIVDHSESKKAMIAVTFNAVEIRFVLIDYGIGIFRKIQNFLNLEDPKYAILELAKGKFTTDEARHSGEGVYFTSRVCDRFYILSGDLFFRSQTNEDWVTDVECLSKGTRVFMKVNKNTSKNVQQIFDEYAPSEDDYGFSKTTVSVKLLKNEGEKLVSRSQAKRLVMRFDKFKEVILDFKGVKTIGQAFADEVFRVFQAQNPNVRLVWVNTSEEIEKMIKHVLSNVE